MFEKLSAVEDRYAEIGEKLTDPSVISDNALYRTLMKEYKTLTPLVETYRDYQKAAADREEARSLLEEGGLDRDFREMVEEELHAAGEREQAAAEALKILLLPKDPNDERNVIMEIRGGAGGEEAALFARALLRRPSICAARCGWEGAVASLNATERGGVKEVSFSVAGEGAYSKLKFESGVHRVQRVPETETQGRIHTSTVTVAVLPEAEEVEVEIAPEDLKIDVFRASGAGGQHVNKTESAIRMTHLPTGIVVECQDERSQFKNREKALKILRSRVYEQKQREADEKLASQRRSQVGTGDRSERIRTYNYPQSRVTDHRIGLTLYKLDAILDGDLDELIDALRTAEQTEKLQAQQEGF